MWFLYLLLICFQGWIWSVETPPLPVFLNRRKPQRRRRTTETMRTTSLRSHQVIWGPSRSLLLWGWTVFNVYKMKLNTSDTKCSHLFKLVPVADSESDADFTEDDESEDETFTVKNKKKVVKLKTEKKAAPAAKNKTENKDKKPTKASKAKGSGTFSLFLNFTVWQKTKSTTLTCLFLCQLPAQRSVRVLLLLCPDWRRCLLLRFSLNLQSAPVLQGPDWPSGIPLVRLKAQVITVQLWIFTRTAHNR